MAVDSRDKRAAATAIAAPWRKFLPTPTGSIGSMQRRQLTGNYPFGSAGPPVGTIIIDAVDFIHTLVDGAEFTYTITDELDL